MGYRSKFAVVAIASVLLLAPAKPSEAVVVQRLVGARGPSFGAQQALVTIEVRCNRNRVCPNLDTTLQELLARHPTELRIVYGMGVADYQTTNRTEAMLEAWEQGLFLEFRARLLRPSGRSAPKPVEVAAQRAGLDVDALTKALKDKVHLARVRQDSRRWRGRARRDRSQRVFFNGKGYAVYPSRLRNNLELWFASARKQAQKQLDRGVSIAALSRHLNPRERDTWSSRRFWQKWANTPRRAIREGQSPIRGPEDADITILMFADAPSREVRSWTKEIEEASGQYPDRIRVVHKTYLRHSRQATGAHILACAHLQGKAWTYIDETTRWYASRYEPRRGRELLVKAGVDLDQLAADLAEKRCQGPVNHDRAEAQRLGLSRPTWFVNGRKMPTNGNLLDIIEEELRPGLLQRLRP